MPKLSELLGVDASTVHHASKIADALRRAGVPDSAELRRIAALPRRQLDIGPEAVRYVAPSPSPDIDCTPLYARLSAPCGDPRCQYCADGPPRLRGVQSAMLCEAAQANGGLFNAGAGQGKTLASILFHSVLEARRTVVIVPPNMRAQMLGVDEPALRRHFHLPPVYAPSKDDPIGPDGVYVIAYSELSATGASDLLDQIEPDLIVPDEAQNLKNRNSARTRRFMRYMNAHACRLVAMSGTLLDTSICDFAHLSEYALRKGSPVPLHYPDLVAWADAIDNAGEPGHTEPGALTVFCEPGESVRQGFQRRLTETSGVISTTEIACSVPIQVRLISVQPPQVVQDALAALRKTWAWDEQEYVLELDILRVARMLAQGWFYRQIWPAGQRDQEWLDARNAWNRAIRQRLLHTNQVGLDSAALLTAAAERGDWTPGEWWNWLAVRERPEPGKEAIELSRYLVDHAVRWASAGSPGIVWVDGPVLGSWLHEAGIPYYGEDSDSELIQADPNRTIACSMKAHGTGKNLPAWSRNLLLHVSPSGLRNEQLIARTHRSGQRAGLVQVDVLLTCPETRLAWESALHKARRIQETMKQPQRLLAATIVDGLSEDALVSR
jgi:hypothetical protein